MENIEGKTAMNCALRGNIPNYVLNSMTADLEEASSILNYLKKNLKIKLN